MLNSMNLMMNVVPAILIYGLLKVSVSQQQQQQKRDNVNMPIVSIRLDEVGFHRRMHYTIQFDYTTTGKNCEYILKQFLPADTYVSTDELLDLKRMKKLNTLHPGFVDIELPTELSRSFDVLIRGAPKTIETLSLPIHFRYHAPRDYTSFVTVEITKPEMFFKCTTLNGILGDVEDHIRYCLDSKRANIFQYNNNNQNTTELDCNWINLDVQYQLTSSLSAKIPVGNRHAYYPVLYITIALSWIITIWVIKRTYYIPRCINEKLQQQQQQKSHR